jgi:hypothetical protein
MGGDVAHSDEAGKRGPHHGRETDAKGIYDEELINDVGWSLCARCQSPLDAGAARAVKVRFISAAD